MVMTATGLSQILLRPGAPLNARRLIEASVHRPNRGRVWVASFRDETGRQRWRSTGQTDRRAAWIVAQEWERAARQRRSGQEELAGEPDIRGWRGRSTGGLTQREVALILCLSERAVREIEGRAMDKLRRHPALRALWREWSREKIGEGATSAEDKLMALMAM
jgi:Sigma-70, region 4